MSRNRHGSVLTAALLATVVAACTSAPTAASNSSGGETTSAGVSSPLVLRLAGPEAADGYVDEFVAAVDQLSSGSIKIELVENTRDPDINIEQQYIEDAKANRFDLVQVAARAWDVAGVNVFRPFVAPFLITNYDLEQAVIASPTADAALAGLAPVGLVGIALVPGGMRHPVGSTKPILALADLAGAHVAIVPSGVAQQTFQAFGATAEGFLIGKPADRVRRDRTGPRQPREQRLRHHHDGDDHECESLAENGHRGDEQQHLHDSERRPTTDSP
jgi:TRAP-type C4-dicarboxylate transport system substrate-binding protein